MKYDASQVASFVAALSDTDTGFGPAEMVTAAREVAVEVMGIGFEHPGLRSAAMSMCDLLDQAEGLL